jgi:ABC-type nitrate/sulfonate/bicarbonate transport system ATPase subunit
VADTLVSLRDVTVRRGRRTVLHDVSLDLVDDEVIVVMGPNGAGKSTLLDVIGGRLRATGTVERHGRVATVLQDAVLASRSVRANVDLAQAWWGVPRRERRARTEKALAAMRADHLARRQAARLSGGERRRVHLARGVALGSDVLLIDEPFAGLDPRARASLVDDTASALRGSARATVVVVHELGEALALGSRLVVVIDGRIAADGEPATVWQSPPTIEAARFLGYDGELRRGGELLLTRPYDVVLDEEGEVEATVTRAVLTEYGARLDLVTENGRLSALDPTGAVAPGQAVRLHLTRTATFPASE